MKNTFVVATMFAIATSVAQAQDGAPPAENMWLGEFIVAGKSTGIILHDRSATPGASSVIDVPSMNARGMPVAKFNMTPLHGSFELQGGPELLRFDGALAKGGFAGKVLQGAQQGKFTLVQAQANNMADNFRAAGSYQIAPGHVIDIGPMDEMGGMLIFIDQKTLREGPLFALSSTKFVSGPSIGVPYPFVIAAEFLKDDKGVVTGMRWRDGKKEVVAKKITPHRIEEVSIKHGEITLKGALTLPLKPGPHPAIVLAHGSGDTKRNVGIWNSFFVRQGFAVLSLDKRGVGASSGDWHQASMDDLAGDWLAGVDMLKQRADIDVKRIGVHGSSQGGWTAPLMAARSQDISFIIVRAGSAVPVGTTMAHEIAWSAREGGMSEVDAKEAEAAALQLFALSIGEWKAYDEYANTLKGKPWARYMWPLNFSEKGWGKPWAAMNAPYDPAATLAKLKVPTLWFLADLDHNVPSDASERALIAARGASGNMDISVVRLAGTGHSFVQSKTGNSGDFVNATKMTAGYFDKMESWLKAGVLKDSK